MQLTVAMIARDEASRIGASLESVRAIADQIVVVDSGSTDATCDIARSFGATVVPFVWCDDFAAARNAAFPDINSRWTLWLDADERVVPESTDRLSEMLAREDALGYGVIRRDYVNPPEGQKSTGEYVSSIILRIFRNDLGIRYTGRCHEQPQPWPEEITASTGLRVFSSPVILDHYCDYYFEGRFRKSARNGRLLDMEVRDRPGRLYWMIQCGATLLDVPESSARGHEVMRDALGLIAQMRANDRAPFSMVELALEYAAYAPATDNLPFTPDEAAELAQRWFPNAAPVIWMRARRAFEKGDYEAAIPILRRMLKMGLTRTYDIEVPFDHAIVADDARLNLGTCLLRIGEIDEAQEVLEAIDPKGLRGEEAAMNLTAIAKIRNQFPE